MTVDVTAVHPPGTDLAPYAGGQAEQYRAQMVMTPEQAKALDDQVRACTKAVLREGTDYGVIPGTGGDQVLLKPGAEKLLQWFGFAYRMDCLGIERGDDGRKEGVTYRCTVVKRIGDPRGGLLVDVATCEGYAGYDEPKFYQSEKEAQDKAEAKERMWAKKDRRPANPTKWQAVTEYRAPWNTIIKMAQKRALVGATIDATAAAGLFSAEEEAAPGQTSDGASVYALLAADAGDFTTQDDGDRIFVEAASAARDGLITPGQATLLQNRVKIRQRTLAAARPVDVDDVARQAATNPSPAAPVSPVRDAAPSTPTAQAAAGEAPDPTQPAATAATSTGTASSTALGADGPSDRHRKLVGAVQGHFKRLGFADGDRAERLWAAGKLAGIKDLESLSDLDPDELATIASALAKCKTREQLERILPAAGQPEGGSDA